MGYIFTVDIMSLCFDVIFFFFLSSYINQRNRSWNIVESEKALVVRNATLRY